MSGKCSGAYLAAATGRPISSIQLELISTRDTREALGLYLVKFSELTCRDDGMMVAGEKKPKGSRGRHLERTLERSS
jgi:hypothetical protein